MVNGEASRLRALVEVARLRPTEGDDELLEQMAAATSRALRYRTVVVNIYRPARDDFHVACVHGSASAREALLGTATPRRSWRKLLQPRFLIHGVYHLPRGTMEWAVDDMSWVPEHPAAHDPEAWDPEDALFAPMQSASGALLGILSVDEPVSGRRPTPAELEILGAVAAHAGVALGVAREAVATGRQKAALSHLLRISAGLGAHQTVDALLTTVCEGVQEALGFERAAVFLPDAPGDDRLRPRAHAGVENPSDLAEGLSLAGLDPLLQLRFDRDGCYLASGPAVRRHLDVSQRLHSSTRNGRGPYAWNHHWLLVPLIDGAGELIGLLWADDPSDCLLPDRERLQALRVFANQAASALESADHTRLLRHLAEHDPLTGLRNRRDLGARIDAGIHTSGELSVLVCDLDHFKRVNDLHGHEEGDRILAEFGELLSATARSTDLAVRLGGEEFAVILPGVDPLGAVAVAERLRRATRDRFAGGGPGLTVSIGVASQGRDGEGSAALLSAADKALNAAKRLGRDRVVTFDAELVARVSAAGDARRAELLAPVLLLAETLDLRDPSTARHSQTVGRHAELLARRLGWSDERAERMRIAGLLHDVGKVGVPDAILAKPGPLEAGERAAMRRHCELGAQIVEGAGLPDVAGWVLAHHERLDGSGYPRGLAGDEIPVEARILAVADAFEAMTADRPYREAMSASAAGVALRRGAAGGQFDPGLVEAFLAALEPTAPAEALA